MDASRRSILLSAATVGGLALAATSAATAEAAAATGAVLAVPDAKGQVVLDLAQAEVFVCTLTGDAVFSFANWPTGAVEPVVVCTQDAAGGHRVSFSNVSWLPAGAIPAFETAAGRTTVTCFLSTDAGATVYGQGGGEPAAPPATTTPSGGGYGVYGDGSDGAVVLDGTANPYSAFLGRSGNFYWLLRDVALSSLTVKSGVVLQLAGGGTPTYRLFCSGTAVIESNAFVVTYPNTNASGSTGGGNLDTGTVRPGVGGPGGTTGAGAAGTGVVGQPGAGAGAGGTAKAGTVSGGAGGASGLPVGYSLPKALPWASMMAATGPKVPGGIDWFPGGASGGAGAGDGTNKGGAGGTGGNPLFLAARTLVNDGRIAANGGKGGSAPAGNCGGGGGGQGGPVMLITGTTSGSGTVASAPGVGGAGAGTGTAGADGGANWVVRLVN